MIEPKENVKKLKRMKDFGEDRLGFVRMDKNERSAAFDAATWNSMLQGLSAENITAYPDQRPLYDKLARSLNLETSQLLLTSGSDAAIKTIFEVYVNAGDEVVYFWPTYAMIDVYADLFQAQKKTIGYNADLSFDFEGLLASLTDQTRVAFIANPNQPTGTLLTETQMERLAARADATNTMLVFDEAYQQFTGQKSALTLLGKYTNVVVTQTFSKAYGLAALRLGFIAAHKDYIDQLYKVKTLCDITLPAIVMGSYLVDHPEIVLNYASEVQASKKLLAEVLPQLNAKYIPGAGNFVHMRFADSVDLKKVAADLKAKGYLVRISGNGLPAVLEGCIRISLGSKDQTHAFLNALKETLKSSHL